ncbi:MAG: exopolysaccharide biosynthesis polyprenyl glycosylphosphotransferase [Pseudomonadota bacterium]
MSLAIVGFSFLFAYVFLRTARNALRPNNLPRIGGEFLPEADNENGTPDSTEEKVKDLGSFPGIEPRDLEAMKAARGFKRAVDVVVSLLIVIAMVPLLVLASLAIAAESRGPILFRQKRVGLGGNEFFVLKFRSMELDAEREGPQWAQENDPRITRVGQFLRKSRFDELPQIINVLRGEMSLIGPRPERPEFVETLEKKIPHYQSRHLVKPGITGWAQVKHQYTASVEGARDKLKYDLYYIKKYSPLMDMIILILTAKVVIFGIGSR